jgi:hypothetical protein
MYLSTPDSGKCRQVLVDSSRPSRNSGARTVRWLLFLFAWVTVLCPHAFAQCTLSSVQGVFSTGTFTLRTITAAANCGTGSPANVFWGDGTGSSGPSPLIVNHTFPSDVRPFDVTVDGGSDQYVTFPSSPIPSSSFAGDMPSQVTAPVAVLPGLPSPPAPPPAITPITIHFECGSAIDSSGKFYSDASAAPLYFTCNSNPANVSFAFNQSQNVEVDVGTSGRASTFSAARFPTKETYAAWAVAPIVLFLGVSIRRRRARLGLLLGVCAILCLSLSIASCGGGFSLPPGTQVTEAGQYQVNVISVANGAQPKGFVQTTLIVPLTVSPTQ